MVTWRQARRRALIWGVALALAALPALVVAQVTQPGGTTARGWYGGESQPPIIGPSPYLPDGRTISGDTGEPIPCRCRAHEQSYKVDEVICLATARGLLKARCARAQNITTWIISDEPCAAM